jgi:predicted nucleotidyltransferase
MLNQETLYHAAQALGEAARPAKVFLFGSYARGDADEGSDVDFMVIKPEVDNPGAEMARLSLLLGEMRLPADVLVYSEAEAERRRDWCSSAVYWALREGKLLYESRQ